MSHAWQIVEGVEICACLDPASTMGRLAIDTAKLLPAGVKLDIEPFDYGDKWGACAIYPDGRRHAFRFDRDLAPTPALAASMLEVTNEDRR